MTKLTARQAARMLRVPETRLYRWIDEDAIPHVMVHHRPMFHRLELLEWAMAMELPVHADLYEDARDQPLTMALVRGGPARALGDDLAELAAGLPIERAVDREVIRAVLDARSAELFVIRAADRIAIPKARSPLICAGEPARVLRWQRAHLALADAIAPARVVVLILAPTIKQHLQLLSRLSLALHDDVVRAAVQRDEDVIGQARRWEQALEAAPHDPEAAP